MAAEPAEADRGPDGLTYAERLREAPSWNKLMSHLEIEAERQRRAAEPSVERRTA